MRKSILKSIAMLALMFVSIGAWAQPTNGDGEKPFVNSTHTYSVTAEDATNNGLAWTVTGGTVGTDYSFTTATDGQSVEIKWLTAGSYTVEFRETSAATGSCVALRSLPISVITNDFVVSTSDPSGECHDATAANVTGDQATQITFTVSMNTNVTTWNPDWNFKFTLTPSAGISSISDVSINSTSLAPAAGEYTSPTITGTTNGASTVNIVVTVVGDVNTENTVALSITQGEELDYHTPDSTPSDNDATQTIYELPATSTITAN
ncbi:hypothetical protein [Prolixibacter sp. SD074]|uniref:hypothetical protein n=1 Tax=Prolixibacter sp. SD074 TaxID=2652391 RepID=UPI001282B91D|nr:hypothetical protein [Prolixibacter sp. SD074]GET30647.1 hypothetical protein SD074_28490 [Prolixibacter sp. SD074]